MKKETKEKVETVLRSFNEKYIGWVLDLLLIFIVLIGGLLLYWHFAEYDILEPEGGNYQLEKTVYCQGDSFEIPFKLCKLLPYPEEIYGRFLDGVIYNVPDQRSNFAVGCYDTYLTAVGIPETLPAGNYMYEEQVVYHPNPIKEISYTFSTQEFTVLDSEDVRCK